jgi:hypothetical protein
MRPTTLIFWSRLNNLKSGLPIRMSFSPSSFLLFICRDLFFSAATVPRMNLRRVQHLRTGLRPQKQTMVSHVMRLPARTWRRLKACWAAAEALATGSLVRPNFRSAATKFPAGGASRWHPRLWHVRDQADRLNCEALAAGFLGRSGPWR